MDQELRKLLSDEISREFQAIPEIEDGSKEQQLVVNNAIALYRLMIDDLKVESETRRLNAEHRLALKKQKDEVELKTRQLKLDEGRSKEELCLKKKQYEIDEAKYHDEKDNRKDDKKDELKDRIFKWSIGIAELMLPIMFYNVWMKRGFQFEREGTYTSTTFRGLFNNFKPVKK